MGKKITYLGGSTVIKTWNLYSRYPFSRGRRSVPGALSELTGADYAAEIAACKEKQSSIAMANNLRPYVVKAIKAAPPALIAGARNHIRREGRLPSHLDGQILASVKRGMGRNNLEESKRRAIRSIAINLILNPRSAKPRGK